MGKPVPKEPEEGVPATAVVHSSAGALAGRLAVHVTSEVQSEVAATGLFIEWGSLRNTVRAMGPRGHSTCASQVHAVHT